MVVVPARSESVTKPVMVTVATVGSELVWDQPPSLFDVGGVSWKLSDEVSLSSGTVKSLDTSGRKYGNVIDVSKGLTVNALYVIV